MVRVSVWAMLEIVKILWRTRRIGRLRKGGRYHRVTVADEGQPGSKSAKVLA
jgi:hypothetical protein